MLWAYFFPNLVPGVTPIVLHSAEIDIRCQEMVPGKPQAHELSLPNLGLKLPNSPHWWMPTSVAYLFVLLWTADSRAAAQKHQNPPSATSQLAKLSGKIPSLVARAEPERSCVSSGTALTAFIQTMLHCHQLSFPTAWTLPWAEETVTFYILRFVAHRPKCRVRP